jgi:hypothetical protein
MKPISMTSIIDRKRYSTDTATLLSGDDYWDGHNWERACRNQFLYRTPRGAYFTLKLSSWQEEMNRILPLSLDEAIAMFEGHKEKRVGYNEAFPGIEVEEA